MPASIGSKCVYSKIQFKSSQWWETTDHCSCPFLLKIIFDYALKIKLIVSSEARIKINIKAFKLGIWWNEEISVMFSLWKMTSCETTIASPEKIWMHCTYQRRNPYIKNDFFVPCVAWVCLISGSLSRDCHDTIITGHTSQSGMGLCNFDLLLFCHIVAFVTSQL